jgi:hypothetical protein
MLFLSNIPRYDMSRGTENMWILLKIGRPVKFGSHALRDVHANKKTNTYFSVDRKKN